MVLEREQLADRGKPVTFGFEVFDRSGHGIDCSRVDVVGEKECVQRITT